MGEQVGMHRPWQLRPVGEGMKVTRLEVFFDLVFVYALFNVARSTFEDLSEGSLLRGLLTLALLWWCWISYVWVGNSVRAGEGAMPIVLFAVMAGVFVVALTLPEAFIDLPGGLSGPLVFAACYFVIRALTLPVFWHVARHEPDRLRRVVRLALPMLVATALLVASALIPPGLIGGVHRFSIQASLWTVAVIVEYGAGTVFGGRGWHIVSATHWTERYELIVIIALGELIISVGAGSNPLAWPITWPVVGAAILGITIAASLWWTYFDIIALAAQHVLRQAHNNSRLKIARDGYMYLHLPMIIGLLLLALGAEEVLEQVSDTNIPLREPLQTPGTYLLFSGVILFLLGHLAFQLRLLGTIIAVRAGAIVVTAILILPATAVPALAALGILTAVCLALAIGELFFLAGSRRAMREAVLEQHLAHEARETEWRQQHNQQPKMSQPPQLPRRRP